MKKVAAMLILITILGPVVAIPQYSACEGCHFYFVSSNYEVAWECHYLPFSKKTSCVERPDSSGCDFYACCGRTYCTFWV